PSGRGEARAGDEAEVASADATELETAPLRERTHPDERRAVERLQAGSREDAVRASQRDDVGHGRERDQLQQLVLPERISELPEQRARENERDAGAREVLV